MLLHVDVELNSIVYALKGSLENIKVYFKEDYNNMKEGRLKYIVLESLVSIMSYNLKVEQSIF